MIQHLSSPQYFGVQVKILIRRIKTYSYFFESFNLGLPKITRNDLNFAEGELRRQVFDIVRLDVPRNIKSDEMIESIVGACDRYKLPKKFFDSHIQLIVDRIRNAKLSTRQNRTRTAR